MKTPDDCLNKIVRPMGITWSLFVSVYAGLPIYYRKIAQGAELYSRYCRFVSHYKAKDAKREEELLFRTIEQD